ncbi:MAG TPA: YifB family Mg chelatase-like AAA ATPase [Marmoricola sp.]|nr:YifB family Mg chelatase-like AAA ATPase [Marmoricola sp.]
MVCATTRTVSLSGVTGHVVDVQADVVQGLVSTTMVGRPDASVSEARDRCRAAITNSSYEWPTTKRVTILLSPADLPKRGSHFDLAIAVAVLTANAKPEIEQAALEGLVMVGELTLDGRLRAVPGVLPMVLAARTQGYRRVMVPEAHAAEAAMVPGMDVLGVRSLAQAVCVLMGKEVPEAAPVEPLADPRVLTWRGDRRAEELDLRDVHGMEDARFALEVAAAGGHHLLLSGPKGSGKTTLAERIPGLLPDLTVEERLELSAVHSLAGDLTAVAGAAARPPFRAPHHSASKASVLGGGSGRVHPGEISRALHGVLFLDEFPLFAIDIIDALRQPLEQAEVTIARGDEVATFPARTMVVLACNPCPCGDYHPDVRESRCSCSEVRRRGYRDRVSGPVTDRLDIVRHITPVRPHRLRDPLSRPESSSAVRARVTAARARQADRFAGSPWRVNADIPGPDLESRWPLTEDGRGLLDAALCEGRLTRRGAVRVHRVAWTLADLRGLERPGDEEVDLALALRLGEPLPVRSWAVSR